MRVCVCVCVCIEREREREREREGEKYRERIKCDFIQIHLFNLASLKRISVNIIT